jgi:cell wall-associated NlpC family hydrolase
MRMWAPGRPRSEALNRSTRVAAVAAALLVTLPVTAVAGEPEAAEAQLVEAGPMSPSLAPAVHRLFPAGPAIVTLPPVAEQRIGDAPELADRAERPASRSAVRKASPRKAKARAVRTVRVVERTTVRKAPRMRTVAAVSKARKAAAAPRGLAGVAAFARRQVGKPYRWGQAGLGGYDCSGLVKRSYREGAGINLPHQSGAQAGRAYRISRAQARPGDLVVGNGHVGVYMGRGMMVDAPGRGRKVTYRKMYRGLWIERVRR